MTNKINLDWHKCNKALKKFIDWYKEYHSI